LEIENRLREKRQALGLSQKQLADLAGITRQAISALETNQYSPATPVALQLACALRCRVEDLYSIKTGGEIIEGELLEPVPKSSAPVRAQVTQIGNRILVRPLVGIGELVGLRARADGLIIDNDPDGRRARVRLLRDREAIRRKIVVAGCDPAMFLAAEHLRSGDKEDLLPCLMGSRMALEALERGEVHVAGIHLAEETSEGWAVPELEPGLGDMDCMLVTFAYWEEGFILGQGNPKNIRAVGDMAHPGVRIVNREIGSGARRLLDRQLRANAIAPERVNGYDDAVLSHLDVASRIKAGLADVGIGVRSAAAICGLDFVPLQRERYDLVIPKPYYETLTGLKALCDTIVSRPFREELEALGGYDTRDTGKLVEERRTTGPPDRETTKPEDDGGSFGRGAVTHRRSY